MTLAQCRELKRGTKVHFKDNYGWWREGTFLGMVEATKCGTMSASDLFNKTDWVKVFEKGRKVWEAKIEYLDDHCRVQWIYLIPRRISLV